MVVMSILTNILNALYIPLLVEVAIVIAVRTEDHHDESGVDRIDFCPGEYEKKEIMYQFSPNCRLFGC
jgi:hypothetical protein